MRVLVTGGTGYLGSAIVRALARDGHTPIVFSRSATRSAKKVAGTFFVDGDVCDRAAVARAAEGVDAICHTAALVSIWRSRVADFDEINVGGLQNVIDVCASLRIPRLVYTSSFLACPPHGEHTPLSANDYQRTKVAALTIARNAAARGIPIVTLIPGVIYGPGTATEGDLVGRLVRDHLAWRLPGLVGADRIWSFTYIDDVANAHVAALTMGSDRGLTPGHEIVIGGENAPQIRAFEILRELTGARLPLRIPYAVAELLAGMEEARSALFTMPPLLTRGVVEMFRRDWPLESARAALLFGYSPTPLATGIRQTFAGSVGTRP